MKALAARVLVPALMSAVLAISARAAEMQVASGSYVGNGDSNRPITGLGFAPEMVVIKGDNPEPAIVATDDMPNEDAKILGNASGFKNVLRSFDPDGFTVRNDPEVNKNGDTYYWIAFRSVPGRMAVGSYAGDLVDNRTIDVGFQPAYVMVWADNNEHAVQRFAAQTGDATLNFHADGELPDLIQSFVSNGFNVGTDPAVNGSTTYYYAAWAATPGTIAGGSYTGNGSDDRAISGPGFGPLGLVVARREAGADPVHRTAAMTGDVTLPLPRQPGFANGIQAIGGSGFQVGTDPRVNASGSTYYWTAFQNAPAPDLAITCTADKSSANEGDSLFYVVQLANLGLTDETGIEVTQVLPSGFAYGFNLRSQGSYAPGIGRWTVGTLPAGAVATLQTRGRINLGTGGSVLLQRASVTASDGSSSNTANDADTTSVNVMLADVEVQLFVDDFTPTISQTLVRYVLVRNLGPDEVTGLRLQVTSPSMTQTGSVATHGIYSAGMWNIGTLPVGEDAWLYSGLTIDAGAAGSDLETAARVVARDVADHTPVNDSDSATVTALKDGMRVVTGSYSGNGSSSRAITGVGFQPDLLIIKASTAAAISVARTRTMFGDMAKELGAATAPVAARIVSLDRDGFTVGTDASVNQAGATYHWTAFLETAGQMTVGSYTGDAADDRSITGAGFQPGYAIVMGTTTNSAVQRYASQSGDVTLYFQGIGELADRIQRFDPDGFQVGTSPQVNGAGATYHWVAWNAVTSLSGNGYYVGNGVDDRNFTSLAFRPHHLFVTRRESGVPTVMRSVSMLGNLTVPATAAAGFSNGLQALQPLGFQVGTDATVNTSGNTYFAAFFRDATSADIRVTTATSDPMPAEGDTTTLGVTITNLGYASASSIQARGRLPAGLTYRAHSASQGSYDSGTGVWTVGTLANGTSATLALTATVDAGTAGTVLHHAGYVLGSSPADLFPDTDADSVALTVQLTDLAVGVTLEDVTPTQSEPVRPVAFVRNEGPDSAHAIGVHLPTPAWSYVSSLPSAGTFDPPSGLWSIPFIAPGDSVSLALVAALNPGLAGTDVYFGARVVGLHETDPDAADDADSVRVSVQQDGLRVVSGTYTGDGTAGRAITGVGFQPDLVVVKAGNAAAISVARTRTMSGDESKELGAATALVTGRILSLDRDGFTVAANASVNQSGATYYWTAFLETPGQMKVGSYTGDGTDNRSISGVGFRPEYALVLGDTVFSAVHRFGAQTGDVTLWFQGLAEASDRIQRFDSNGFQVGTTPQVNAAGVRYHYVAWSAVSALTGVGTYGGNGLDNRDLTGLGFRPDHLFVTRRENGVPTVLRNRAVTGNFTLPATGVVGFSNGIQNLQLLGFQVGTDGTVNASGNTYYFAAFRDVSHPDIRLSTAVNDSTPAEGDTLTLGITVTNYGYATATAVQVRGLLPAGLTYRTSTATQGGYDPGTGVWSVSALANGTVATLGLTATVDAGTAGTVFHHAGYLLGSSPGDPFTDDDADSVAIAVQLADLALTHSVDDATPIEGQPVTLTVRVENLGPHAATGVSALMALPPGFTYGSSSPSQGSYDPGTGVWTVGSIAAGGFATASLNATVPATAGFSYVLTASILAADQTDLASANDADTTTIGILAPGFRLLTGSYIGDGSPTRALTGLGFQPDVLFIRGAAGATAVVRTKTMSGDASKELGLASSTASGRILSLDRDGFTVGASASVNLPGVTYYWSAFLETPGRMVVGAYTGSGADNRSISGVGFQPSYAMVMGSGASSAVQRYKSQTGDASLAFQGGPQVADRIQSLEADGFQIGANLEVNGPGNVYHYVAWSTSTALISGGSYAGSGTDDRDVPVPGFRPDHLVVTRQEGGSPTVARNRSVEGDLTLPLAAGNPYANGLQRLVAGGFQVGDSSSVNAAGGTYHAAAFRDPSGADIGVATTTLDASPDEGDTLTLICTVTNHGFQDATGVRVVDRLPTGLQHVSSSTTQGTYDSGSGAWDIGALANGASASLFLTAQVAPGTAGSVLWHTASVEASSPTDPFEDDDADSVSIRIPLADLALDHLVDDQTPLPGETVTFTVRLENRGPDSTAAVVHHAWPAEILYVSGTPSQGAYDHGTGTWTVGALAPGQLASLQLRGTAPNVEGASAGASASITDADHVDPVASNDVDSSRVTVIRAGFRLVTGSYVGDGGSTRAVTGVGFQPDLLLVKGTGAATGVARTKYMSGDFAKELGAATAPVAGRIVSLDGDGFTVGADGSVNQAGVTYYWSAFLETPGQMKVGSYTGSGVDNRSITGAGFQPSYAMVLGGNALSAVQRYAGEAGDASLRFQSGAEVTNRIQRLDPDGFQVGSNGEVNAAGVTYYWVAWSAAYSRVQSGLYLGNGTDNRVVSGTGWRPQFLMIKRLDSSPCVLRSASIAGDLTLPAGPGAGYSNAIQGLVSDGFTLGTDAAVNSSSQVYFWLAFADLPTLDLEVTQTVSDSTPNVGDVIMYTIELENLGPENATGVVVNHALPAGLTYQAHLPSIGVYDPGTGVWTLGSVANGDSGTLAVSARVNPGTGSAVLLHTASLAALDQTDLDASNDQATTTIRVQSADLEVRVGVDRQSPSEGDVVAFTVSAKNHGPDSATTVQVRDLLPPGLSYQGDATDRGTYDPPSGIWSIGTLAMGDSVALQLDARVAAGTGGTTITNHARVVGVDQSDPVSGNQVDSISVFVAVASGIQIAGLQDSSQALPGQRRRLITFNVLNSSPTARVLERLTLTNRSAGAGSAAQLDAELGTLTLHHDDGDGGFDLPADTIVSASPAIAGAIVFDSLGVSVGSGALLQLHVALALPLASRDGDILDVSIADTSGVVFDQPVSLLNAWPVDPAGHVAVNGMSKAQLSVAGRAGPNVIVGSQRNLVLDVRIPSNGYEPDVLTGITLDKTGTAQPAVDIARVDVWGDGSDGDYDAGAPDDFPIGTAAWDGSAWSLTGLSLPVPIQGRRIFVSVDIASGATVGRTLSLSLGGPGRAGIEMASMNDGPLDSAASAPVTLKIAAGPSLVTVTATQNGRLLLPGGVPSEMLAFRIANRAAQPETLKALTLTNRTTGPGTAAQLDAGWQPLRLVVEGQPLGSVSFASGRAAFTGLAVVVVPGDTLNGVIESGASLAARDGDFLDLSIASAADVAFTRTVQLGATWPVDPTGTFPVDGMSAAQVQVGNRVDATVLSGTTRNLALEVVVPANGYEPDALEFLLVRNAGDAVPGVDITRVEAWRDDGDGTFEPGGTASEDLPLGVMSASGGGWALGKFSTPIPATGVRVFFSCDIGSDALEDRTVRLFLPYSPLVGIGVASANDGPRDRAIENPVAMTISTSDRVTLATQSIAPGSVAPGDTGVVLLDLIVGNSYPDSTKTLTSLTLFNLTSGSGGTVSERDQQIQSLELRSTGPAGAVLGRSFFSAGKATFSGLDFAIAPQESHELIVVAEIATHAATDGDVVRVNVPDEGSLLFAEATQIAARFPLQSGAAWEIDGMIAQQIALTATPDTTLAPDEGPVLALDWVVPRNGYADDRLEAVRLTNLGTAGPLDLFDLHLWKDGGDARFDAGLGDDVNLGSMVFSGGRWSSQALADSILAGGVRLFASVVTSSDPADSASVQLAIPVNGIGVGSDNDGPNDAPVVHSNRILISRSRLLTSIELSPLASVSGDTLTTRMTVRNNGDLGIYGVVPSELEHTGDGRVAPLGSVEPPFLNLEPGTSGVFTWTMIADSAGIVFLAGSAAGTELGTGFVHHSLTVTTAAHSVYAPALGLDLFTSESMPFSINRGQTQVVPISLTLSHPGSPQESDVLVQRLSVTLEDEFGSGVVPSTLLSRAGLNEGATNFAEITTLPTSGSSFDLVLPEPVRLVSGGTTSSQVTLSLSLDISDTTRVSSFRITIPDSTALLAADAVNGDRVEARLGGPGYPIQSGLTRVVAGGTQLDVAGVPDTLRSAGRGQDDVELLSLSVNNPGPTSLGPDVRLGEFEVTLVDSSGAPIHSLFQRFQRLRVTSAGNPLLTRTLTEADTGAVILRLSPLLTVPINTPTPIRIAADLSDSAVVGPVRLRISRPESFAVRNSSTGETLPAVFATQPIDGRVVVIEAVAETLLASRIATPQGPISIGATDVRAMTLVLAHPDTAGVSAIVCQGVVVRTRDQQGQPVAPASLVDRARIVIGGVEVGLVTDPGSSNGEFMIPLQGVVLEPGQRLDLDILWTVEASAFAGLYEMSILGLGLIATDRNLGTPVVAEPDSGAEFPLSSGSFELIAPARELVAGFRDAMPAAIVADGQAIPVARLTLRNQATAGEIRVDRLTWRASDRLYDPILLGSVASRVEAWVLDTLWAARDVAPDSASVELVGSGVLSLLPGPATEIEVRIVPRAEGAGTPFRIGCQREGINVLQPASPLLRVSVISEEGLVFPFWTSTGSQSARTLKASYSNFPNPFAAGREATTFVYYLKADARVTLSIWTAIGDPVVSLITGGSRSAGLQQLDRWDGRNGSGHAVMSGVYVAELVARYADGSSERILRKVAVAR